MDVFVGKMFHEEPNVCTTNLTKTQRLVEIFVGYSHNYSSVVRDTMVGLAKFHKQGIFKGYAVVIQNDCLNVDLSAR